KITTKTASAQSHKNGTFAMFMTSGGLLSWDEAWSRCNAENLSFTCDLPYEMWVLIILAYSIGSAQCLTVLVDFLAIFVIPIKILVRASELLVCERNYSITNLRPRRSKSEGNIRDDSG